MLLDQDKVVKAMDRLSGLTTDVRTIYRPFVSSSYPQSGQQADNLGCTDDSGPPLTARHPFDTHSRGTGLAADRTSRLGLANQQAEGCVAPFRGSGWACR